LGVPLKVGGEIFEAGGDEVVLELPAVFFKPEEGEGGQDLSLVGDAVGHDHVVRADAIGGDDEQLFSEIVNITHLPAPDGEGEVTAEECVEHGVHGMITVEAALVFYHRNRPGDGGR